MNVNYVINKKGEIIIINLYFRWHSDLSLEKKQKDIDYLVKVNTLIIKYVIGWELTYLKETLEEMYEHQISNEDVLTWAKSMSSNIEKNTSEIIENYRRFGQFGFCPYI